MKDSQRTVMILRVAGIFSTSEIRADVEIMGIGGRRRSVGLVATTKTSGVWATEEVPIPEGKIIWARLTCDSGTVGVGRVKARLSTRTEVWSGRKEGEPLLVSYMGVGMQAAVAQGAVQRYGVQDVTPVEAATGAASGASIVGWGPQRTGSLALRGVRVTLSTSAVVGLRGVKVHTQYPSHTQPLGWSGDIQAESTTRVYGFAPAFSSVVDDGVLVMVPLADWQWGQNMLLYAEVTSPQAGDVVEITHALGRFYVVPTAAY